MSEHERVTLEYEAMPDQGERTLNRKLPNVHRGVLLKQLAERTVPD